MKKTNFLILAVISILSFSGCYKTQENNVIKSITTMGSSTIFTEPDLAVLVFTVTNSGWSAKNITTDNDTISNRLIEAIKKIGVSEEDISKSNCTISNPQSSYEAKRNIVVNVRNLTLVPQIVDCKTGSIRLKSTEYKLSDDSSVIREARIAAVKKAQDAANLLAGTSAVKISGTTNVYELESKTELDESGKIKYTAKVSVTFEVQ